MRTHPYPVAGLPEGLDPASGDSVRSFMTRHRPPSVDAGRFLFAFIDEEAKYQSVHLRHGLAGHREPPPLHRCVGGVHVIELHAPAVHRIEYRFELASAKGETTLVT